MSAAPEYKNAFGVKSPIGRKGGAARVLWPGAIGEREEGDLGEVSEAFLGSGGGGWCS